MEDSEKKKAAAIAAGIAVAAALICWLRPKAQEPDKAMLFGQVTDIETGGPIKDISVDCNDYTGKTNADGLYQILNIEPGTYSVIFTDPHLRYQEVTV